MGISAAQVKELRERTGAGMMECKKALVETGGDMEKAIEHLRKTGLAKADKKASRVAAEGQIILAEGDGVAALVEVNCETDFVAKDENFQQFANEVAQQALAGNPDSVEALMASAVSGGSLEEKRQALVAKIGENVQVRRFERVESSDQLGAYIHGGRIGVLVEVASGDEDLARDLAMHVAASRPEFVSVDDVPEDVIAKEKEILIAQAEDSGKPPEIVQKMVEGRLRKHLSGITLLGQPFVKDPDVTVEKLLKEHGASVKGFVRLEVGEGIEREEANFADEVMAQVRG
ncbi:MAG: translation elongation factor Ts [Xanthomonadales bacterium]|nr:translation elongation factor Ts [Xanthomonadales bacterium]